MAAQEPWLKRQHSGLRALDIPVSLEVEGIRIRPMAMMPPKTPKTGPRSQQRISTGLRYPEQAAQSIELARNLGKELKIDDLRLEPFDWGQWSRGGRMRRVPAVSEQVAISVSGEEAIKAAAPFGGLRASQASAKIL